MLVAEPSIRPSPSLWVDRGTFPLPSESGMCVCALDHRNLPSDKHPFFGLEMERSATLYSRSYMGHGETFIF